MDTVTVIRVVAGILAVVLASVVVLRRRKRHA